MSAKTKIQWTMSDDGTPGATWNPITGCTKVSDGCLKCYITGTPPFRIAHRKFDKPGIGGTTGILFHPERLSAPLHWRKPRRVFVNSLSDLFHEDVPTEYIARVFAVMAKTPQHVYQVLSKRHGRMRSLLRDGGQALLEATNDEDTASALYDAPWPLPNVWLGVSTEDQHTANLRIPALLETPAAIRFISAEPLLGPIDLQHLEARGVIMDALGGDVSFPGTGEIFTGTPSILDWIIAGGESGPGARPMDPAWVASIVEQCRPGVNHAFVKQLGSVWAKANGAADRKGGDLEEWPAELRVRQFPQAEMAVAS
ncbi:Gp37Gp68 family protein [Catenulispora acidiphila DSM 44928]|uniref:Gp37Gp68 family protein n=1 Tax=Catenulispora acidiphila (strain DSM 44928 / JCM 14897 / NBRC 102108 / NRRL B-24433 / ID139908) TaxID=479433 RepID=C7Q4I1_CATAD|nr:phage Gp37/Gp68 family protein [Catenulispora acidiphila]ACU71950.1 Gp37Gp68 family protein [Catenulispora acidiphila DSM 44928]